MAAFMPPAITKLFLGSQAVCFAILRFGLGKFAARGVHIAQCEIRHIVAGMSRGQPLKILFSLLVAPKLARYRSERCERQFIVGIESKNLLIDVQRFFALADLYQQIPVQLQSIWIFGIERQSLVDVLQRAR